VNYDSLTGEYRAAQAERVRRVLHGVLARSGAPALSRVVPEDDALVIGTGRALVLAILFLDISSFSARPSGNHAEQHDVLQVLNVFFSEMVRIATDYGGTVEKNTGDGLMAYFEPQRGAGNTTAQHRAVAAALTMMHANDRVISPMLRDANLTPLQFRVGIDYGQVTVARLGAPRQFNANVAIGTPANIASKILARASADEIVIGESVALGLPKAWHHWLEYRGPSGFEYSTTRQPYPLYRYVGRWI
jgi:adenylate cyclase